ncbi:hypothetical protein O3M35_012455 [Rhynocoris fuscipes]|uniref:Uncharacterized protein n=1 Tax=Rhynocoris fuscipes TaxID=488301 RepID=A0AAW1CT52_9HEMI
MFQLSVSGVSKSVMNRELELLTRDKQNDMSSESIMENNNISNNRIRQLANAYDELMRQQNMAVQPSSVQQSMEKRAAKCK